MHFPTSGPNFQKKGQGQERSQFANFVVFGWFTGLTMVVYFMFYTFITIDAAFHIFLAIGAVAASINYFKTRPKDKGRITALLIFNFFGLGMLLCGLFLTTNYLLRGPAYQKAYQIVDVDKDPKNGIRMNANEIRLESDDLKGFDYIVNYSQWKWAQFKSAKAIRIIYADGFFGYRICLGQQLVYE